MKVLSSGMCHNLDEQGFTVLSIEEKTQLNIALRVTPALCIVTVLLGMYYASWQVLAVLSVFGLLGTVTKRWQPFDVLYNTALRYIFRWPKLPPSPAPKRFACFIGLIFLLGATMSFYFGWIIFGYIFSIFYIFAAGLMAMTHFCVGSWVYHHILRK
ncbi:MAG TPA: DUF4395 domain-containing protein [Candidatus Yonathbacteria bacterium]|nr:DUF4395 domain-containing protein [Candidatus Yonathbacteria bacterium]